MLLITGTYGQFTGRGAYSRAGAGELVEEMRVCKLSLNRQLPRDELFLLTDCL